MRVPGIYVAIKGDYTELKRDLTSMRSDVKAAAGDISDSLNNALSPGQISKGINKLTSDLVTLSKGGGVTKEAFAGLGVQFQELAKHTGMTSAEVAKLQERMLQTQGQKGMEKALKSIADSTGMTSKEMASMMRQMGLSDDKIKGLSSSLNTTSGSMDSMASMAVKVGATLAAAFTVRELWEFSKGVGSTKMEFEALERTLKAVTGSQYSALASMQSLAETSDSLGLRLSDAAGSYKTLAAAAKGTTLEGVGAKQTFEAVAMASSVLGLSADDTSGILRALGQMISKGRVQAEELRGQLGERLPGAFQIAAKSMGVTTAELDKMLTTGGVATETFLPKFAVGLQNAFGSGAADAGSSGQAAFNRLQNAWDQLKLSLADTGAWEVAKNAATTLAGIANATAYTIRLLTGSLQGAEKVKALQADIFARQAEYNAMDTEGAPGLVGQVLQRAGITDDPATKRAALKSEIAALKTELAKEAQNIEDAAQEQFGTQQQNAIKSGYNKQLTAIKGGEKAVLDAWAGSSDKKLAAWATNQKEMRDAFDKASKGEITQGAMDTVVAESSKKYSQALDDLAKKGQGAADAIGKADAQTRKLIDSIKNAAMSEQASFLGDTYGADQAKALKDYEDTLDGLAEKLVGYKGTQRQMLEESIKYWAEYRQGVALAKADFDEWARSMTFWGDAQTAIGEVTFDPDKILEGSLTKLQVERAKALQTVQGSEEKTAALISLYDAKETEIKRKGALERDDVKRREIESRLGLEADFSSYLKDRLALDTGSYKDELGKRKELWGEYYDTIKKGMDAVEGLVGSSIGNALGDAVAGKFKGVQSYVDALLSGLRQAFASFIGDLAKIAVRQYIVIPIMGQIMGTQGSFGSLTGGTGEGGGTGMSAGDLLGYAGKGSSLFSTNTSASAALAAETANPAFVGPSVNLANAGVPGSAAPTMAGAIGPAVAGAGIGYMAGGLLRPDNPTSSYLGAGAGLLAGGVASMAGLGALAATGVGALVAIPAAIAGALLTPNTVTTSKTGGTGITINMQTAGAYGMVGYDAYRQTTEGFGGSSSTSHFKGYTTADPALQKAWNSGMDANTKSMEGNLKQLNMGTDALKNFSFPMNFDVDSEHMAMVLANIDTAMAENSITAAGLKERFDAVALSGEVYGDELNRLGSALSAMSDIASTTGIDLERFTQQMDAVGRADYVYQLALAAGGADKLAAAMARLSTYGYTSSEQMVNSLNGTATSAGKAIAALDDSSVNIENFWARFRQAVESGMDPSQMAAWSAASARMEQWETAKAAATAKSVTAYQANITALQTQISTIQQLSQAWDNFSDQMVRLKASLLQDKTLSTLSPLDKLNAAKTRLDSLTAEAQSGSTKHLADIDTATKDYLTASLEYYGANTDYFAAFDATSATIDSLQALAGSQVSAADQQVAALTYQISQNQAQIDALNNINQSVVDSIGAINNISGAIGGAIQAANAAQRVASVDQYISPSSTMAAYTGELPAGGDGNAAYTQAWMDALTVGGGSIPQFATGGLHKGGWFVSGDDPLKSGSGELGYSSGPVRLFSNKQSRAMLSGGSADSGNSDAKLDAIGTVLVDILGVLQDGGGTGAAVEKLARVVKTNGFKAAGQ